MLKFQCYLCLVINMCIKCHMTMRMRINSKRLVYGESGLGRYTKLLEFSSDRGRLQKEKSQGHILFSFIDVKMRSELLKFKQSDLVYVFIPRAYDKYGMQWTHIGNMIIWRSMLECILIRKKKLIVSIRRAFMLSNMCTNDMLIR